MTQFSIYFDRQVQHLRDSVGAYSTPTKRCLRATADPEWRSSYCASDSHSSCAAKNCHCLCHFVDDGELAEFFLKKRGPKSRLEAR